MAYNSGLGKGTDRKLCKKISNRLLGKVKKFNSSSIYRKNVVQKKLTEGTV